MRKRLLLIFMTCLLALGISSAAVFAEPIGGMYYSDETGVLSSDEWDSVNDELQIISEDQECDVFIQVADDFGSMTPTEYADNVYEEKGVGYGVDRSGIVLVVNYDSGEWAISTAGYGITAFTDAGQTYIMDQVAPMLRDDPYGAFMKFADLAEDFLIKANAGVPYNEDNLYEDEKSFDILIDLLIGIGFGVAVAFIIVLMQRSSLKTVYSKAEAGDYVRPGSMNLTASHERFLYRDVDRVKVVDDDDSSTHISSSGREHGGSDGRF